MVKKYDPELAKVFEKKWVPILEQIASEEEAQFVLGAVISKAHDCGTDLEEIKKCAAVVTMAISASEKIIQNQAPQN